MKIVVVYFSGQGHTKKQAESVFSGLLQVSNIEAHLIRITSEGTIADADWDLLYNADAIIFGSPTYMGSVAWQFKKFADETSKLWLEQQWKDKLAGGFTNSSGTNGDKLSTLHYLFTLSMQHSMIWSGTGIMPASSKAAQRNDINYIDSFSGLMAQSPTDANTAEAPAQGDLETAKLFGVRIANATIRWGNTHS